MTPSITSLGVHALFVLVTNVFVVQGGVLYVWTLDRLDDRPTPERDRQRIAGRSDAR